MTFHSFKIRIRISLLLFVFLDLSIASNEVNQTTENPDPSSSASASASFSLSQVDNFLRTKPSSEFDEILNWEPPYELKKNLPYFLSGFDDDGCSMEYGKWDIRGQIEKFGFAQVQKYIRQMLTTGYTYADREREQEMAGNNATEKGEKIGACESLEYSVIVDMDGFTNRQFAHPPTVATCLNLARTLFSLEGKGERLKGLFGINFNYLGTTLYSLAAPILGTVTSKIYLFGTNPDRWKPKLLKAFPKSALPGWMGGSQDFKPLRVYG